MIQRDLGDGTYASYDEPVPPPVQSVEWTVTVTHGAEVHTWTERAPGPMAALIQIAEKRSRG